MISYLLRRNCRNCHSALYPLCHTHNEAAKRWRRAFKVAAIVLAVEAANVLAWRYAGRRWLP